MDIRSHLEQQATELAVAITQLDEQHAWAKAHGRNVLAGAYIVAHTELLCREAEVNKLLNILCDEQ